MAYAVSEVLWALPTAPPVPPAAIGTNTQTFAGFTTTFSFVAPQAGTVWIPIILTGTGYTITINGVAPMPAGGGVFAVGLNTATGFIWLGSCVAGLNTFTLSLVAGGPGSQIALMVLFEPGAWSKNLSTPGGSGVGAPTETPAGWIASPFPNIEMPIVMSGAPPGPPGINAPYTYGSRFSALFGIGTVGIDWSYYLPGAALYPTWTMTPGGGWTGYRRQTVMSDH